MVLEKNFNFNCFLFFIIGFLMGVLISNNINVYASTWNENNNFNDINSMTQFTTLNDILQDSFYSADKDSILDFIHSDYKYKYIVSYCNSVNCSDSSSNRSVDLIGFDDPIKISVIQNGNSLKINFLGPENSKVHIYDHSQIWGNWYDINLTNNSFVDYREYNYSRSIFDVSYYENFNSVLPNFYTSDTLFKGTQFLDIYKKNISAFKDLIIFFIVLFIIICLICKKFGIFLTPIGGSLGGGRKW